MGCVQLACPGGLDARAFGKIGSKISKSLKSLRKGIVKASCLNDTKGAEIVGDGA